jgi:hypothetical protein
VAAVIEARISGLAEIEEKLEQLPPRAAKAVIRTGLLAAGEVWRREMEARARQGWHHGKGKGAAKAYGVLARNILVKARVTNELEGTVQVGPGANAFWSLELEFGRSAGTSNRGRKYPGMQPYPFIRISYESRAQDVLDEFVIETKAALARAGLRT